MMKSKSIKMPPYNMAWDLREKMDVRINSALQGGHPYPIAAAWAYEEFGDAIAEAQEQYEAKKAEYEESVLKSSSKPSWWPF